MGKERKCLQDTGASISDTLSAFTLNVFAGVFSFGVGSIARCISLDSC